MISRFFAFIFVIPGVLIWLTLYNSYIEHFPISLHNWSVLKLCSQYSDCKFFFILYLPKFFNGSVTQKNLFRKTFISCYFNFSFEFTKRPKINLANVPEFPALIWKFFLDHNHLYQTINAVMIFKFSIFIPSFLIACRTP